MICKHGMLLLLIGLASGCALQDPLSADMSALQGEHVSTALAAWGAPEDERAFGDETVLIWRDRTAAYSLPAGSADAAVICERMLAVADDGTITGWRWRGNACEHVVPGTRAGSLAAAR